jgi:hypothetical protein
MGLVEIFSSARSTEIEGAKVRSALVLGRHREKRERAAFPTSDLMRAVNA